MARVDNRINFSERAEAHLTEKLNALLPHFPNLGYQFSDEELRVQIDGDEDFVFVHPNSARAFLDGLLLACERWQRATGRLLGEAEESLKGRG